MSRKLSPKNWKAKFGNAFAGVMCGVRGHNSFAIHLPVAVLVIAAGLALELQRLEMLLLIACVAAVVVTELINSSVESLARAVTKEYDENVKNALDISAGAVLITCVFAATIGALIFGKRVLEIWW